MLLHEACLCGGRHVPLGGGMSLQKVSLWNEASLCMRRHGFDTGVTSVGVVNYSERSVLLRSVSFVTGGVFLWEEVCHCRSVSL